MKILIVKPSALGDIIHTLPAVTAIRKHYNAHIGWVVSRPFKNLLENNEVVDNLHIFERGKWGGWKFFKNWKSIVSFIKEIRCQKYDIVIDFQGLLRTGIITVLSGSKKRVGFKNARELAYYAYTQSIDTPPDIVHAIERYKLLAYGLGVKEVPNSFPIEIDLVSHEIKTQLPPSYVVIVPGARWSSKRWPPEYFASFIDKVFSELHLLTVIVGAPNEVAIGEEICQHLKNPQGALNFIGTTSLKELAFILKNAQVVVSNDSGPMHLAAALNTKTIALFGPTDPKKIGPFGTEHIVLKKENLCAPNCKRTCSQNLKCLRSISPEEVLSVLGS